MKIRNDIQLKEMKEYTVRNVSQKQIYDSYMGILRISPNRINNKDNDDPTSFLNTLVDFNGHYQDKDGEFNKNTQISIRLSDSDGNCLPIYFVPKAFETTVSVTNNDIQDYERRNIINIATNVVQGYTFVSNKFTSRSQLRLTNPKQKYSQLVFVLGCNLTSNSRQVHCQEILTYPIQSPNDDIYFNNKNKYGLFEQSSNTPRQQQVDKSLLNKRQQWYRSENLIHGQQHVKINGRYINVTNDHNQEVPVLHTRDYVLGSYDGHSVKGNKVTEWYNHPSSGADNCVLAEDGQQTKLSWIRFDNLIWDSLEQILNGQTRHLIQGRYNQLGYYKNDDICDELFGNMSKDSTNFTDWYDILKETAPILGQGHQQGLVSYHAMPFSRYWFHRCRQVISNMSQWERQKNDKIANSNIEEQDKKNIPSDWDEYGKKISTEDISNEELTNKEQMITLKEAFNDKKISAASNATVSSRHSLVKDFLLCDNKQVDFKNYPNLSIKNDNILNIDNLGCKAQINDDFIFQNKTERIGIHGFITKTPDLYVFHERYPRFIRGLNWNRKNDWNTDSKNNAIIVKQINIDDYGTQEDEQSYKNRTHYIHSKNVVENNWDETINLDCHGNQGIDIEKNIDKVACYGYTFEYLTETKPHYHKLFTTIQGGRGPEDYSKKQIQVFNRYSDQTSHNDTMCLWQNPLDTSSERGLKWANYSFDKNVLFFDNYTPVPNAGLTFLSAQNYNPYNSDKKYDSQFLDKYFNAYYNDVLNLRQAEFYKNQIKMSTLFGDEKNISNQTKRELQKLFGGGMGLENILQLKKIPIKESDVQEGETINQKYVILQSLQSVLNTKVYLIDGKYYSYNGCTDITKNPDGQMETPYSLKNLSYPYRGTVKQFEQNGWQSSGWGYYDARKQKWNTFSDKIKTINHTLCQQYIDNKINFLTHQASKHVRKQLTMKLNQSEARMPISYYGKAQFSNRSIHVFWWKKKRNWLKIIGIALLGLALLALTIWSCGSLFFSGGGLWAAMGGTWTGITHGVLGAGVIAYPFVKYWGSKWVQAKGQTGRTNIGSYRFASFSESIFKNGIGEKSPSDFSWQCLSSLPYTDTQYLGYGDISQLDVVTFKEFENKLPQDGQDFWVSHNVMDRWNAFTKNGLTYDRLQHRNIIKISGDAHEVDVDGPYPSHLNLIPIIRL